MPEIGIEPCSSGEFVTLLDRAVKEGSVDAQFVRGNCFYGGTEGYPQDFKRALDDFIHAAHADHADSAVSAGAMFHNGVGVLKDQRKAFELYQLGGELGSKEGWINVVDCWQQGLGVPKSEETARYIKETMLKKHK
jgi:TPR repeat protein